MHGAPARFVVGSLASPPRVCAGSGTPVPTPSAGSRTIPLALGAVGGTVVVDVARDIVVDEAPYIVPYIVVDGAPYIDADAVVLLPDAPEQYVDEPTTPVEDGVACAADPDIVGKE